MDNPADLNGRFAIVTGGGKGVGRGISQRLLNAGAQVLICGRTAPDRLPVYNGREADFTSCDVRDSDQIAEVVSQAAARYGRIDMLVNNAGGAPPADAATASPRFVEAIIQLNLTAPMHFSQAVNRVMQTQESGGCIINIASVSAQRPSPGTAAYGAAKAGLISLTRSLAIEWAPAVRVNAIVCGLVKTEQSHLHYGDANGIAAVAHTIPLGRLAEPEDIGNACVFLGSPLAAYVSGACLEVHGGGEPPAFLSAIAEKPA
jgi:NAD(P)-dependent dehydrogenase (short-subunit alcohol dehydrogenase family)